MSTKKVSDSTVDDSRPRYVTALERAKAMMGESGVGAFDRAKLLIEVFDDVDWRAKCGSLDDFGLGAILDDYLNDLCLRFHDLRQMVEFYPKRGQWSLGRLADMYDGMKEAGAVADEHEPKRSRRSAKFADLEAANKEKKHLQAKLRRAEGFGVQVKRLERQLAEARDRIVELERENAELRISLVGSVEMFA